MIKVKKLGLPVRKGAVYTVTPKGEILVTEAGETRTVQKVTIKPDPAFLHYIDDDGDLARAYNTDTPAQLRRRKEWKQASALAPASAKLDRDALFRMVLDLVEPATSHMLATAGAVDPEDPRHKKSVAAYDKEYERLVAELAYMFGAPEQRDDHGATLSVWKIKGRELALVMSSEAPEHPATITLRLLDAPER